MAATDVRPKITMACQVCKHRNYITKKNRRNDPDRMDLKKFCPNCRQHTDHRETRESSARPAPTSRPAPAPGRPASVVLGDCSGLS